MENEFITTAQAEEVAESAPVQTPETAEPEQKEPEKAEESKESELPKGVQKRINKLTARLREAEEKLAQASAKPPEVNDKEPKIEDFDFDPDKYEEARVAYRVRQELSKAEKEKQAQIESKAQQEAINIAREKFDLASEKYDDFEDVVYKNQFVTDDMVKAVFFSDLGPEIAYFLGKNPEESKRIASLPPMRQLIELGKLEARFTVKPEPKTTKAPEPIKPVSSAGKAPSTLSDDLPLADWMKLRQQTARR